MLTAVITRANRPPRAQNGEEPVLRDCPAELREAAEAKRALMLERLADVDDEIDAYVEHIRRVVALEKDVVAEEKDDDDDDDGEARA